MTRNITTGVLTLGLATIISTIAIASPRNLKADTDQDGKISLTEFNTQRNAHFASIDTDADGRLSKDERKSHHADKKRERADKRFAKLDENSDGVISHDEYGDIANKRTSKHASMKKHRRQMRKRVLRDAHKADINQDGFIDRKEFDTQGEKIFGLRDVNSDGVLSKADRELRKQNRSGHN